MIAGPSLFDLCIFLGVLFAMLFSKMPKQFAMSVCLGVALWGILINVVASYQYISVKSIYSFAGIAEWSSAFGLILYARIVKKRADRFFFYLMASFLLLSSSINLIFIPIYLYTDYLTFGMYKAAFHTIAVLHVLVMLGYSDGIRSGITNIRRFWVRDNAHYSNR